MKGRKQKKSSRKWLRFVLYCAVAVILFCAGCALVYKSTNKTKVTLSVPTPAPTTFLDSNSASFMNSSHIPDVNNNRGISTISPMFVSYRWTSGDYAPAFKMNLTSSDVAHDIKMTPYVRGTWSIRDSNTVAFTPESDWLPDTKYTVNIGKKLFNDDVQPNSRSVSFTTPKLSATIDSFNIYPDPSHERMVVGVAVVSFNYPIETNDFADRVSVKLGLHRIKFSVRFDRFNRTAIITTDPIHVDDEAHTLRLKINSINSANTSTTTKKVNASTTIESIDNFFK